MSIKKRRVSRWRFAVEAAVLLIFVAFGLVLALPNLSFIQHYDKIQREGQIITAQVTNFYQSKNVHDSSSSLEYSFSVRNKTYRGVAFFDRNLFKQPPTNVPVRYLAEAPQFNYADIATNQKTEAMWWVIYGSVAVLGGLGGAIYGYWALVTGREIII